MADHHFFYIFLECGEWTWYDKDRKSILKDAGNNNL